MYDAFYRASSYLDLSLFTTALFMALFAGVLWWVFSSGRESFSHMESLPLQDDDKTAAHAAASEVKP